MEIPRDGKGISRAKKGSQKVLKVHLTPQKLNQKALKAYLSPGMLIRRL